MKVLVYPHDLGMGGSQLNAIELAARVRDLGVECAVFGRRGTLNARIEELGLRFIESVDPGRRPSIAVARQVRRLIDDDGFDIVHGYEWPPALEAALASRNTSGTPVATVMSMAVAPFIPRWMHLSVGTRQIAAVERAAGRPHVALLEPPVDLEHNRRLAQNELDEFAARWNLGGRPLVVCVTRFAAQLKLEGLLSAIRLAERTGAFQLLVVGDGPAREQVSAAAALANDRAGANTVVLTGELFDPRAAYGVADIILGMGGSALRGLAFAKPLVVQGEMGFFQALTPSTVERFRWQGWYGVGDAAALGEQNLQEALEPLLLDPESRASLGAYGRQVVEEFSLTRAARRQLDFYQDAMSDAARRRELVSGTGRAAFDFAGYKVRQRIRRWAGTGASDDFNAAPVATSERRLVSASAPRGASAGPIVYLSGTSWDSVPGTDHRLAQALARRTPVVWVDPPQSAWSNHRRGRTLADGTTVAANITRVGASVPAGVTRPLMRELADRRTIDAVVDHLGNEQPRAWVCANAHPMLALVKDDAPRVYLATDDFVSGAALWGMSPLRLARDRELNLRHSDLVLAVSPELADLLSREGRRAVTFANGCDWEGLSVVSQTPPADDVDLPAPVAGVVGQFNERTDLSLLEAVQGLGLSLLLVGPLSFATAQARDRFTALAAMPGVRHVGRVAAHRIPSYLTCMAVGLTPYASSPFNRRSFPLKTVEYLAAGLPVVSSDVPPMGGLPIDYVHRASSPAEFAALARRVAVDPPDRRKVRASVEFLDWNHRADDLMRLISDLRA